MRINEILKNKGSHVHTIAPEATVKDAIRLFRERKIGAAPVGAPGALPVGIFTERDALHGIADRGEGALGLRVADLMSHRVHTCAPDDVQRDVMKIMVHEHVRHVLVVADGEVKGIVSVGDLMKHRLVESQMEINVMRDYTMMRPMSH